MSLMTELLVLIVVARLLGQLFARFRQPELVGEMLAGVVLGPSLLGWLEPTPALSGISELAVFLVILSAGLEMNFKDVLGSMRGRGLFIAILAFFLPFFSGVLVGMAFDLDVMRTVFLGLCVSITALPVAIRILESFKLLNSEIARYSIATAILNDVTALLILGVILSLPTQRTFGAIASSVAVIGGKLLLLISIIVGVYALLGWIERRGIAIHKIPEKLVKYLGNEALFGMVILFVLLFGTVSELLGFHFVVGAFFGALLISKDYFVAARYKELERTLASITAGFLAPVFFATLGLEFSVEKLHSPLFVGVVLFVSVASKVLAGWLGGRISGLSRPESLGIGIVLNGRGVMELVIASIAYKRGFIGQSLFSTLLVMGVATTLITPILFRRFVEPKLQKESAVAPVTV